MSLKRASLFVSLLVALLLPAATPALAQDVVTVATVTASANTVDVPVYIRDRSGTPLGGDRAAGSRIQSISLKVVYAPASSITSVSLSRAGVTAALTPIFESKPVTADSVSLLATFQESTNRIPFTLDATAPGDQVARLSFTLSPSAAPGTTITLSLDAGLTQLTDEGGSAGTKETAANGHLALVNGAIVIPDLSVTLSPSSQQVASNSTGRLTVTISRPAAAAMPVALTSLNPSIGTVQSTVTIAAGSTSAGFDFQPITTGSATVRATLPASLGGATATASVTVVSPPPQCTVPAVPQLTAPPSSQVAVPYTITWPAAAGATEYIIDEATDSSFSDALPTLVSSTSATFIHTEAKRYYYRVRARNRSGPCDVLSPASTAVSVLVTLAPVQLKRVVAVVGSNPGAFGSYFKTSVQLYNASSAIASGRILFHPQGRSATAEDPSIVFTLEPGKTMWFDDLLPAMGVASGIGSADLIGDAGSPLPMVLVRVFNDAGPNGTSGLTQEQLRPEDALRAGATGVILAPIDIDKLRLNVGVRSLEQGAAMQIVLRDRDGAVVKTTSRTYPQDYFAQVSSAEILDGHLLKGGETISFEITSGSAFIYGSTTDNITNDPSMQFARVAE